jgi:hypothetical protein
LLLTLLNIDACSPDKIDPSFVAERWSSTLSAFNIDPVFPPRQVEIGDLFLIVRPPQGIEDKDLYKRRALRIARLDLKYYLLADQRKALQIFTASTKSNTNVFSTPDKVFALPPTAYPGFNVAEIRRGDIGAAFPVKVFHFLIGGAWDNELVMSVSIPDAEDIEIPAIDAYTELAYFCGDPVASHNVCFQRRNLLKHFTDELRLPTDADPVNVRFGLVTHVYYARQIDYSFTTQGGQALTAAATSIQPTSSENRQAPSSATTEQTSGAKQSPKTTSTTTTTTTSTTTPTTADSTTNSALQEVQNLEAQLAAVKSQLSGTSPGGTLTVISTSAEGSTLRQTFANPVAFGYRAYWFSPLMGDPPVDPKPLP